MPPQKAFPLSEIYDFAISMDWDFSNPGTAGRTIQVDAITCIEVRS